MRQFKIITVVGARPQFVKAAALSPCFRRHASFNEKLIHTGQHFDANMSDVFFEEMGIPKPDFNLGIGGGTHGQNTGRMIEAIEGVLIAEKPDLVLVFGDTDSTLAAAIAASKLAIPLAHVEAGLRSNRRHMPEEINRVVTDRLADFLYTPSSASDENLRQEGIPAERIVNVGDIMHDVVRIFTDRAKKSSRILETLALKPGEFRLMTLHRKENTDDPARLASILDGISSSRTPIVLPLHPRTAKRIAEYGLTLPSAVRVIDPLGYLDTLCLESASQMILTDSGGMQKEAYFHGVPCVTLRDETEWTELVDIGANVLTGSDADRIRAELEKPLNRPSISDVYGDGFTAERIVNDLLKRLG